MLSVSSLSTMLYCKRKFFLNQALGLRELVKEPMIKGTVQHRIYEMISKEEEKIVCRMVKGMDLAAVEEHFHAACMQIIRDTVSQYEKGLKAFGIAADTFREESQARLRPIIRSRAITVFSFMITNKAYGPSLWSRLSPKILTEQLVASKELGIRGIIDQIEDHGESTIPVELKTGACPKEGAWPSHKIQVALYALLLEARHQKRVPEGIVHYLDCGKRRPIVMNPFLKKEAKDMISKAKKLLADRALPDRPENNNKCRNCGLREQCYDDVHIQTLSETTAK